MHVKYVDRNGLLYGVLTTSQRNGKTVDKFYSNFGRVIDKERDIYT